MDIDINPTPQPGADSAPEPKGYAAPNNKPEADKLPLLEDAMQLARSGDVQAMKSLFDSGKVTPGYKDGEGITPLHVSF